METALHSRQNLFFCLLSVLCLIVLPAIADDTAGQVSCYPIGPPQNLAAAATDNGVLVTWEKPADTGQYPAITGYRLYRLDSVRPELQAVTVGPDVFGFEDTAVTWGDMANPRTHRYKVSAITTAGEGQGQYIPAPVALGKYGGSTNPAYGRPGNPSRLTATATAGGVMLAWSAPKESAGANPVALYRIYRSTGPVEDYKPVAVVSGSTLQYDDPLVAELVPYYNPARGCGFSPYEVRYKVVAADAGGHESMGGDAQSYNAGEQVRQCYAAQKNGKACGGAAGGIPGTTPTVTTSVPTPVKSLAIDKEFSFTSSFAKAADGSYNLIFELIPTNPRYGIAMTQSEADAFMLPVIGELENGGFLPAGQNGYDVEVQPPHEIIYDPSIPVVIGRECNPAGQNIPFSPLYGARPATQKIVFTVRNIHIPLNDDAYTLPVRAGFESIYGFWTDYTPPKSASINPGEHVTYSYCPRQLDGVYEIQKGRSCFFFFFNCGDTLTISEAY